MTKQKCEYYVFSRVKIEGQKRRKRIQHDCDNLATDLFEPLSDAAKQHGNKRMCSDHFSTAYHNDQLYLWIEGKNPGYFVEVDTDD